MSWLNTTVIDRVTCYRMLQPMLQPDSTDVFLFWAKTHLQTRHHLLRSSRRRIRFLMNCLCNLPPKKTKYYMLGNCGCDRLSSHICLTHWSDGTKLSVLISFHVLTYKPWELREGEPSAWHEYTNSCIKKQPQRQRFAETVLLRQFPA